MAGHRGKVALLRVALACGLGSAAPASAAPPLEAYGDLPGVEDISVADNGKAIAFVGTVKGERRIVVIDTVRNSHFGIPMADIKFDTISWVGSDFAVAEIRATEALGFDFITNKIELSGALLVPADGSKAETVFAKSDAIAKAIWGYYGSRRLNGKWYGYFSGLALRRGVGPGAYEFDHGRPTLYAVDLKENRATKVADPAGEGNWGDWLVDDKGVVAVTFEMRTKAGTWDIRNHKRQTIANGVAKTGKVELFSFNHDGTAAIYSIEDAQAQHIRIFEVPLAGGAQKEILADVDIERFYVDSTNGRLMGYLPEGKVSRTVMFDPAKQEALDRVYRAFRNTTVSIKEWTPDFSHFLVHTSGNGDSGTWYIVDMAKGKADPIAYERLQINPSDVGAISTVEYTASDGLKMDGILTLPPGKTVQKLPVILFPHGGPHSYDREQFDWWAQAFASRGYAVFQPNFRGSTNRDVAFMHAGYGQWGRKMQSDISDGLAELVRRGIVDPSRVCIMGGSYGGYAALAGVTLQQDIYRCAVAVAPVSDVKLMYETDLRETGYNPTVRRSRVEALGNPAGYDDVSPRRFAVRADAPILLIHGKDDTVVPFKQSEIMADALKRAGKPYEFVTLAAEDHYLSRAATRKQMLEVAMRFVQKHNPAD